MYQLLKEPSEFKNCEFSYVAESDSNNGVSVEK